MYNESRSKGMPPTWLLRYQNLIKMKVLIAKKWGIIIKKFLSRLYDDSCGILCYMR